MQDLQDMFKFTLTILGQLEYIPPPFSDEQETLFGLFLEAAESIVSWNFVSLFCIPRRIQSSFESDSMGTFRPPPSWKETLLKPELLQTFFNVKFLLWRFFVKMITQYSC